MVGKTNALFPLQPICFVWKVKLQMLQFARLATRVYNLRGHGSARSGQRRIRSVQHRSGHPRAFCAADKILVDGSYQLTKTWPRTFHNQGERRNPLQETRARERPWCSLFLQTCIVLLRLQTQELCKPTVLDQEGHNMLFWVQEGKLDLGTTSATMEEFWNSQPKSAPTNRCTKAPNFFVRFDQQGGVGLISIESSWAHCKTQKFNVVGISCLQTILNGGRSLQLADCCGDQWEWGDNDVAAADAVAGFHGHEFGLSGEINLIFLCGSFTRCVLCCLLRCCEKSK